MKKKNDGKEIYRKKPFIFHFWPSLQVGLSPDEWIEKTCTEFHRRIEDAKDFEYRAFYFGGNDLRVYPIVSFEDDDLCSLPDDTFRGKKGLRTEKWTSSLRDLPKITGKGLSDSWEIFYGNMTFDGFIYSLSGALITHDVKAEEVKAVLSKIPENRPYYLDQKIQQYKPLLELIRNKPMVLHYPGVTDRLCNILTLARWEPIKEKKNEAIKMLTDNLIPKHASGKKRLSPEVNYALALKLAGRLTKHLSDNCKIELNSEYDLQEIKKQGLRMFTRDKQSGITFHPYEKLIKWAKEKKEWRITSLNREELVSLIFYPIKFTQNYFYTHLEACPKTLSTKK
jgi:hypothetical protein